MTQTPPRTADPVDVPARALPRLAMVDRGDPLVEPLADALAARYDVVDRLDADLTTPERLLVAATTWRPRRTAWAERFFKSNLAVSLRSRRARAGLDRLAGAPGRADADVVLQTHALFESTHARTVLYVDCTHRQSMRYWPAWNPLRGRALQRWLTRETRQYRRAAHLFAFSEETALSLVEEYGASRDRVTVVGAGVNFDHLPELPDRAPERPAGPPTVLFVGNDFERKGGLRLLEAFARVRTQVPDARLLVVGTPYPVAAQDGVELLGRVHDREQLSRLYAEADVFCLPSYFDPFPGALIEAMAHGLPCVVTTTSGVPEIIEEGVTALTVSRGPLMADDLVSALTRLLQHPDDAAAMGRAGRRRVEERHSWLHVVDRMAPALDRVARTSPLHLPRTPSTREESA